MTGIFIQDTEGPAEIVAMNYYGCDFKVDIYNQEDNSYISQNLSMSELVEPISSVSTTVTSNQSLEDTIIELDDITDFKVSDRVQLGNYIYRIINILDNNITINKGLLENLTSGDDIITKGNLGIYKVNITLSDIGNYTLIGKDSIYGITVSKMIKVQPKSLEKMVNDIKNLEYAILGSL